MTQELSLFDTLLSTGTKSSNETKVSKEGSSLFDDLLKSATTQNQSSGSSLTTVSPQTSSNSPQISVVNPEATIKEGIEVKSDNTQSSTPITKDISTATNSTEVKGLNVDSNITKVEPSAPKNVNTTTNISISNPSILQDVEENIQIVSNQAIVQPKVEVTKSNVAKVDTNIQNQMQTNDNETVVVNATSSRTPSVLDKIQVDKNNKPKSDLESILTNNQVESKEKLSATNETKVENELAGKIDTTTQKVQTSGVLIEPSSEQITTSDVDETEVETKPLQTTDMPKMQSVTNNVVSVEQEQPTDLFTSLTTQSMKKSYKSSQSAVLDKNQKADVVNIVNPISNTVNQNENINLAQSITDSSKEGVPLDTPKVTVNESQKRNIQSTLQQTDTLSVKESVLPVNDSNIVINTTQNTTVENNPLPQEIEVKNQDSVVEPTVKEDVTKNVNLKVDDKQSLKVQESNVEKQQLDDVKNIAKPTIIKEDTSQKVEPLNTKVVQTDTINVQDVKVNVTSDVPKTESTTNKQNAAIELAKLNQNEPLKQTDIVIDDSLKDNSKKPEQSTTKQSNGLLDKLIEDTLKVSSKESSQVIDKLEIKNGQVLENVKTQDNIQKTDIMENIYKSSVSKNISLAAMQNATIAKETLKNGTSVQDIQKSADMLDLNLKSIEEVTIQEDVQNDTKQRAVNIGRAFLEKDLVNKENIVDKDTKTFDMEHKQTSITDVKSTTNNMVQKVVELTIGEAEVLTIQNRIIGARQQLSSMMSDVARAMYENYKPPHTAFRIALNPGNLGSIAILIRSQRADNSLSISMNMSNSSTLESMVANQNELRSALQKTFNDNSSFEFDFKLDPDASGSGFQNENFSQNDENQETKDDEKNTFVASSEIIEEIQEVQKSGTYF